MENTLVIGASGYLGREIVLQEQSKSCVYGTYARNVIAEGYKYEFFANSIGNLLRSIEEVRTIIFAAAVEKGRNEGKSRYSDAAERFSREIGTRNMRLVYISSDAVFSGEKGGYVETDKPDSTTLYGKNLQTFEALVAKHVENHLIIRVSVLYGETATHKDRRMEKAKKEIEREKTIKCHNDVFRSPVRVNYAAKAIRELSQEKEVGIIHIPGSRVSIYDFYKKELATMGRGENVVMPSSGAKRTKEAVDTSLATVKEYWKRNGERGNAEKA